MNMTIADIKNIATILAAIVALLALIKGILEYVKQGAQRRAEHFMAMRKGLRDNETICNIWNLLDTDDRELQDVAFTEKLEFLGLYEEVAIAMNSGLIKPNVVHYMFGYYALRCWESDNFWNNVSRESIYWIVFKDFVEQMKTVEEEFEFKRRMFRF